MLTNPLSNWRDGQYIFNFLEWLQRQKGLPPQGRLGDTFHVTNAQLQEWAEEYNSTLIALFFPEGDMTETQDNGE